MRELQCGWKNGEIYDQASYGVDERRDVAARAFSAAGLPVPALRQLR